MVPTLIEEIKDLGQYERKFVRMVNDLGKNEKVVFVGKNEQPKAVLMNEKTFEVIEAYIETADILLSNPNILKQMKSAKSQAVRSGKIDLNDLRKTLGV